MCRSTYSRDMVAGVSRLVSLLVVALFSVPQTTTVLAQIEAPSYTGEVSCSLFDNNGDLLSEASNSCFGCQTQCATLSTCATMVWGSLSVTRENVPLVLCSPDSGVCALEDSSGAILDFLQSNCVDCAFHCEQVDGCATMVWGSGALTATREQLVGQDLVQLCGVANGTVVPEQSPPAYNPCSPLEASPSVGESVSEASPPKSSSPIPHGSPVAGGHVQANNAAASLAPALAHAEISPSAPHTKSPDHKTKSVAPSPAIAEVHGSAAHRKLNEQALAPDASSATSLTALCSQPVVAAAAISPTPAALHASSTAKPVVAPPTAGHAARASVPATLSTPAHTDGSSPPASTFAGELRSEVLPPQSSTLPISPPIPPSSDNHSPMQPARATSPDTAAQGKAKVSHAVTPPTAEHLAPPPASLLPATSNEASSAAAQSPKSRAPTSAHAELNVSLSSPPNAEAPSKSKMAAGPAPNAGKARKSAAPSPAGLQARLMMSPSESNGVATPELAPFAPSPSEIQGSALKSASKSSQAAGPAPKAGNAHTTAAPSPAELQSSPLKAASKGKKADGPAPGLGEALKLAVASPALSQASAMNPSDKSTGVLGPAPSDPNVSDLPSAQLPRASNAAAPSIALPSASSGISPASEMIMPSIESPSASNSMPPSLAVPSASSGNLPISGRTTPLLQSPTASNGVPPSIALPSASSGNPPTSERVTSSKQLANAPNGVPPSNAPPPASSGNSSATTACQVVDSNGQVSTGPWVLHQEPTSCDDCALECLNHLTPGECDFIYWQGSQLSKEQLIAGICDGKVMPSGPDEDAMCYVYSPTLKMGVLALKTNCYTCAAFVATEPGYEFIWDGRSWGVGKNESDVCGFAASGSAR